MRKARRALAAFAAIGLLGAVGVSVSAAATGGATISAAPPMCQTSGLDIWLDNSGGGGTAGSFYYELGFTNFSGHACTLRGRPGVVAANLHGGRIGSPAAASGGSGATVRLAPRATAMAQLRAVDPGVFSPAECKPTLAAGLRVTPPGQKASKFVPFPLEVCALAGHSSLEVQAVKAP